MRLLLLILIVVVLALLVFTSCVTKRDDVLEPEPIRVYLNNILIDGRPLEGFEPQRFNYTYILNNEKEGMPVVVPVTRNFTDITRVLMPAQLPGSATIEVTPLVSEGAEYETVVYRIFFVLLN